MSVGTAMKLRTNPNLNCPVGVTEKLAYRFYAEGPGGRISLQGATDWSLSRVVDFPTTDLQPGRYKIYAYSMPASMITAWLANDSEARHTSRRTGNTYVELVAAEWTSGSWGACSATCGGGTQARDVKCKNANGTEVDESFCAAVKPVTTDVCNVEACVDPCIADPMLCDPCGGDICCSMPWMCDPCFFDPTLCMP